MEMPEKPEPEIKIREKGEKGIQTAKEPEKVNNV
jgi:hypothetical protein